MEPRSEVHAILRQYVAAMQTDMNSVACCKARLVLPLISPETLRFLLNGVEEVFASEPIVLDISSPCVIVGDIHGHILDMFRTFSEFGLPPLTHYLFLGDIVDRGEFSLESIVFLFILKFLFPYSVHIIRGNHEFSQLYEQFGFKAELDERYPNEIVQPFFDAAFSQMPIAAVIDKTALAVHGGIGPSFISVEQINAIQRPVTNFEDDVLCSVLWSDPSEKASFFQQSTRGTGYLFGKSAVSAFLEETQMKLLIRGHECVQDGVQYSLNRKVVTVFTASNYCGVGENSAGVLIFDANGKISTKIFPPFEYLSRRSAVFMKQADGSQKDNGRFSTSYGSRASPLLAGSLSLVKAPPVIMPSSVTSRVSSLPMGNCESHIEKRHTFSGIIGGPSLSAKLSKNKPASRSMVGGRLYVI